MVNLSARITQDFGPGYSVSGLYFIKQFYLSYPELADAGQILYALRRESRNVKISGQRRILHAPRGESWAPSRVSKRPNENWRPGRLHPNLSWTHYRTLLRVDKPTARAFYEIEALRNNWSARELERQINSLLYERLALSKDKNGLMKPASRGQEVMQPIDAFKDPVVIEFLGCS